MTEVRLLYFADCPHWRVALDRLLEEVEGRTDVTVVLQQVGPRQDLEGLGFRGSPTLLVDGADPFARPGDPYAYSCRVYRTAQGSTGSPTAGQLRGVIPPPED